MIGKRILIDTSKCIACRACQVACQQWHSLPAEDTTFTGSYQNPPDMSGANLTVAKFIEKEEGGKVKWLFFKDGCRHCDSPTCKTACPLKPKAIKRQKNGIVRIDPALCNPSLCSTGDVKPCQLACPFKSIEDGAIGIPRRSYVMQGGGPVETKMRKCDFCYNRFGNAKLRGDFDPIPPSDVKYKGSNKPSCQLTCAPGAILSGNADKMKRKAKRRVNYLKANGHPNANVYPSGLLTHVIWVLTEPPEAYGVVSA